MIKRVFEITLGGGESPMYYCTLCNRPFKPLHEANKHAKYCGKAVPMPTPEHEAMSRASSLISRAKLTDKERKERTEKYFPSPAKAALPDDDDDTQVYKKPWQGLTDAEINAIYEQAEALVHDSWVGSGTVGLMFPITLYKMFEAALKKKNA
jgi:hypothetical protein